MAELECTLPYAQEGQLRREIDAAGAELLEVSHGSQVIAKIKMPLSQAAGFVQRLNDLTQGRIGWMQDGTQSAL